MSLFYSNGGLGQVAKEFAAEFIGTTVLMVSWTKGNLDKFIFSLKNNLLMIQRYWGRAGQYRVSTLINWCDWHRSVVVCQLDGESFSFSSLVLQTKRHPTWNYNCNWKIDPLSKWWCSQKSSCPAGVAIHLAALFDIVNKSIKNRDKKLGQVISSAVSRWSVQTNVWPEYKRINPLVCRRQC